MTPFTHIVVGAGSAGCVVAARIAENPAFNVLLLEAGPDCHEPEVAPGSQDVRRVPMKGQSEMFNDCIDWDIRVELPGNDSMRVAQAKVVGGGSSINGGTALRNVVRDCEEWVQLGNDAWGWESVEPVYASLEKDEASRKTGLHPLTRMQPGEAGKIQQAFVADAMQLGLPWVEDLSLSIPVEQDLPVGANLADHPCVPVVARPKPGSYNDSDFSLQMQARWSSSKTQAVDLQIVCFSYLYATPFDSSSHSPRSLGGSNKPTSRGTVHVESRERNQYAPSTLVTARDGFMA